MKVIISGGSGLIGSALGRNLVQSGYEVYALSRNPGRSKLPNGVVAMPWDGKSGNGWQHLIDENTILINLAGENLSAGRWTLKQKEKLRNSRLQAGKAMMSAVQSAEYKPRLLVQASAVGYYGSKYPGQVDESAAPGDDFLSRLAAEWEGSTRPIEDLGVTRVIIRTGVVMDVNNAFLKNLLLTTRNFIGGKLGDGKQMWSWIHIQDVVSGIRFLLENKESRGVYNLTSPNPVSMDTFGRMLAHTLRRPYWLPVLAFALKILLGEMSQLVLEGQQVYPKRLLEYGFVFSFPEVQQALNNLLR